MSEREPTHRTFIAIELPHELRGLITQHIAQLRQAVPEARASWARDDNLHLTLKFLGNVPIARVPALSEALAVATQRIDPFELILSECGVFPSRGQPGVLWIGAKDPSGNLTRLHHEVENECAGLGFEKEARAFQPHLTIARLRTPEGARRLAEAHVELGFTPRQLLVTQVIVFKSELHREGSKHTALSRHALVSANQKKNGC